MKRNYVFGYEIPWSAKSKIFCNGLLFMGPKEYRWLTYLIVLAIIGIQLTLMSLKELFLANNSNFITY